MISNNCFSSSLIGSSSFEICQNSLLLGISITTVAISIIFAEPLALGFAAISSSVYVYSRYKSVTHLQVVKELRSNEKGSALPETILQEPDELRLSPAIGIPQFNPQLLVEEVPVEEWPNIAAISKEWSELAFEKINQAFLEEYERLEKNPSPYIRLTKVNDIREKRVEIYGLIYGKRIEHPLPHMADVDAMSKHIFFQICEKTYPSEPEKDNIIRQGEPWDTVLVCKDSTGNIQAIALHDTVSNSLGYMVTHPNNIDCHVNQDIKKVRGAGRALMMRLIAQTVLTNQRSLNLHALNNSINFYKKFNFTPNGIRDYMFELTPMILRIETIKSRIPPFDTPEMTELLDRIQA